MIGIEEIKDKIDLPEDIKSSAVKFSEGKYLHHLIKENNFKKTLETGFGLGLSAASIITATNTKHVGIDPFQANYQNCGLKNIEKLGLTNNLEFYAEPSHEALPKLLNQKRSFDFIFIDGDHKFDGQFVDFYYASLLIETNGYIVLHDTWMESTSFLVNYIKKNRKDFNYIPQSLRNIAVFKKIGTDERDWLHFKRFGGTIKSYLTQKAIKKIHDNENSFLNKSILKAKEILK
ncbi:MAG: class I SAM-dependent methyltransferase [Bacteroidetes bacterium]|nr:class I SAM-dependent methyltransferase [Bacteroidota bacterium]